MVSSACRGLCTPKPIGSKSRKLNIDPNKDYTTPLQVETSVEYDLPAHIYPPKGSKPILMVHPDFTRRSTTRRLALTVPAVSSPRPLSTLQVNGSQIRNSKTVSQSRTWCSCGNPTCNQVGSVLSNQQNSLSSVEEYSVYSAGKSVRDKQKERQKQVLQQREKQLQAQQQKQIQVQQQKQLQMQLQAQQNLQERVALQQHLQQQQKSALPRQQLSNEQLISWAGRCQGPCCNHMIAALPPPQTEFLAPGLPPSLLARTPSRGAAGGSPKLRARTRRGLSASASVHLPEYLSATSRTSRAVSLGGAVSGATHPLSRPRSSSLLAATPAPITAHQVASALDGQAHHGLTPRSLFSSHSLASNEFNSVQNQLHSALTSSLLSTVGQSRDSGCSMTDMSNGTTGCMPPTSTSYTSNPNSSNGKNVEWTWSVVDSGFCTPVDTCEDQVMEPLDLNLLSSSYPSSMNSAATPNSIHTMEISKNLNNLSNLTNNNCIPASSSAYNISNNLSWMRPSFHSPALGSSSSLHSSLHSHFLPSTNPHYIPQPIWNLAY